jgi:hypothetical protein
VEMSLGGVPFTQAKRALAYHSNPGISANTATKCAMGD